MHHFYNASLHLPELPCRLVLRELVHITPVHLRILCKIQPPAIRLRSFPLAHERRIKLPERMRGSMQGGNGKRHPRFRNHRVARLKMAVPEQALFLCRNNGKRNIRILRVIRPPVLRGALHLYGIKGHIIRRSRDILLIIETYIHDIQSNHPIMPTLLCLTAQSVDVATL